MALICILLFPIIICDACMFFYFVCYWWGFNNNTTSSSSGSSSSSSSSNKIFSHSIHLKLLFPFVGRKEMFYLTTHSTHFIYDYMEGNVLFNDALNTFYLRLYDVRHMVKNHSDWERGNPLTPHRLLFPISSKGSFICIIPQTGWRIPRPLLHQSWSTGWNEK